MKLRNIKYSVSWIALAMLIAGASLGLVVSFRHLGAGRFDFIYLSLAWIAVVASGIYLFIYASKEILQNEMANKEKNLAETKNVSERKKEKRKSESESLDIDIVARKIVRRISPETPPAEWGKDLLGMLSSELEIMSGVFYFKNRKNIFEPLATYAFSHAHEPYSFKEGEGLTGQTAKNRSVIVYTSIPDEYKEVFSGLGNVKPSYLSIVPIVVKEKCIAVFECAGFKFTGPEIEHLFQILAREIASKIASNEEVKKK